MSKVMNKLSEAFISHFVTDLESLQETMEIKII